MFLPHIEFWPFLGPPLLQDVRVLPHPKFWPILGRSPLFQLLEALFWPKGRPTILNFYPTRKFGHFWAALSKMSLNFSKFLGRLRRHTQCPLSLVCFFLFTLGPWLRSLSHGGPCSLHVVLGLAWLPLPLVTGFFEIAQSFRHRTAKKTKKTKHRRKPR